MRRLLSLCAAGATAVTLTLVPTASAVTCYGTTIISVVGGATDVHVCPTQD